MTASLVAPSSGTADQPSSAAARRIRPTLGRRSLLKFGAVGAAGAAAIPLVGSPASASVDNDSLVWNVLDHGAFGDGNPR